MTFTTLFVTAFLDIGQNDPQLKSMEVRLAHFRTLVQTGVPITVFVSEATKKVVEDVCADFTTVTIQRCVELKDLRTYSLCESYKDKLPVVRNVTKDSFEFLTLMNAKLEFLQEVAATTTYKQIAWIDFNIWHVVKNTESVTNTLQTIATNNLKESSVVIPGCWDKQEIVWHRISWRFCGGFLMGSTDLMLDFAKRLYEQLPSMFEGRGGLTWETNAWAELERTTDWKPVWCFADHNDTIIECVLGLLDD